MDILQINWSNWYVQRINWQNNRNEPEKLLFIMVCHMWRGNCSEATMQQTTSKPTVCKVTVGRLSGFLWGGGVAHCRDGVFVVVGSCKWSNACPPPQIVVRPKWEASRWQQLASLLPLEKFCYGWLHRRLLRRYRPQSAVNCSTLWERATGSPPSTSQVSFGRHQPLSTFHVKLHLYINCLINTISNVVECLAWLPFVVGAWGLRKNWGSHIDASHSRQPLVKGERLVRHEVNAVMPASCSLQNISFSKWARRTSLVARTWPSDVTPKGMLLPAVCHASATREGLRASSRARFPRQK